MDRIGQLIKELQEDKLIWSFRGKDINFREKLLNDVAEVFERHGCNMAKTFLAKREERSETREAKALQRVLSKFVRYPEIEADRTRGRYIIKALKSLKDMEVCYEARRTEV